MPKDEANVIAHSLHQLIENRMGSSAMGALEIAIFDQRDGARGIADVIAAIGNGLREMRFRFPVRHGTTPSHYRVLRVPLEFRPRRDSLPSARRTTSG